MALVVRTPRSFLIPRLDTEVLLQLYNIITSYHLAPFQTGAFIDNTFHAVAKL